MSKVPNNQQQQVPSPSQAPIQPPGSYTYSPYEGGYGGGYGGGYEGGYGGGYGGRTANSNFKITDISQKDSEGKPVVAVIVTISNGSSFDPLFTSVPQISPLGRIAVYKVDISALTMICKALKDNEKFENEAELKQLLHNISLVEKKSVLFNWECCGGWSNCSFASHKTVTFDLVKFLLDSGHMIMFSDFALKALVTDWDENLLGPNPLIKFGEFSDSFDLKFDPKILKECPSPQLNRVAELCGTGSATVHALGGTIAYTVNKLKSDTSKYKLQVLTVASRLGSTVIPDNMKISIPGHSGAAGHVLITYPSGGTILLSCGHWIELSRLDVDVKSLLDVAKREMGSEYAQKMETEFSSMGEQERSSRIQGYAAQFVQQAAPCSYSSYQ